MKILLFSFDLHKPDQPARSLAMGNILSAWRKDAPESNIHHVSFNILDPDFNFDREMQDLQNQCDLSTTDFVAFQVAVWSKQYVRNAVDVLQHYRFSGKIILGGYEITGRDFISLKRSYSNVHFFVQGYGEPVLKEILDSRSSKIVYPSFIRNTSLTDNIPSPYADGSIPIGQKVITVNIETKRGCPYACSYCAHDTVHKCRIIEKPICDILDEIDYLVSIGVEKINIIDPVFNCGKNYFEVAKHISELRGSTVFTLQYRLRPGMKDFLKLCSNGNIIFEIGIQSLDSQVLGNINRQEDPIKVLNLLREVSEYVPLEISVIYGLPGQTVKSFEKTISQIQDVTSDPISAYTLMLLPGTRLYEEKELWGFKEEIDDLGIPFVKESNSFTISDWQVMDKIAANLESEQNASHCNKRRLSLQKIPILRKSSQLFLPSDKG